MTDSEDKPMSRRECDRCLLRVEVVNVKSDVAKVDKRQTTSENRMWAFGAGLVLTLISSLSTLVLLLLKSGPVVASVAK